MNFSRTFFLTKLDAILLNENLPISSLLSGLVNLQIRASFDFLFFINFIYLDAFIAFLNVAFQTRGFSSSPVDKK